MNKDEFIKELQKLDIETTENQLNQLNNYYLILKEENSKTNLTRIIDEKEVYLKHFFDSLTIVKSIKLNNQKILDVGTGAGFPGIVLKIFFPNLKITLLDSSHKKTEFLNIVIKKLKLKNIYVINGRAEEISFSHKEEFDIIVTRAVANLQIILEICILMLKINGIFIAMKGNSNEELAEANEIINKLNCQLKNIIKFKLPFEDSDRSLILIEKIAATSQKYPRSYKIIKNRLKKKNK